MTPLVIPADAVLLSLVFSRLIGLLMGFPFFNTTLIPHHIKFFLILALSFFYMKNLHLRVDLTSFSLYTLFLMVAKEFVIGFAMGLMVNFFIAAFSYAAEILSYFMGLTIVNVFDPTYGQVSIFSKLFIFLFYAIFFIGDIYHYFLSLIAASFLHIPLGIPKLHQDMWAYVIEQSLLIFSYAFKLAFPFALILYLVNLSLALINRLIPQINVFIVGLPLQIFVGIAALALGVSVVVYMGVSFLDRLGEGYRYLITHIGG